MLILGLLGMYFDAAVVLVTSQTLLLKLAEAILWLLKATVLWISFFRTLNQHFFLFFFKNSRSAMVTHLFVFQTF